MADLQSPPTSPPAPADENIPGTPRLVKTLLTWSGVLAGLLLEKVGVAVAIILLAHRVNPFEYGQYISTYAITSLLVVIPGYGLETWLLTRGKSHPGEIHNYWLSSLNFRLKFLLGWGALMLVLGIVLPAETFPARLLLPTVLGLAFESLSLLTVASLRSAHHHRWVISFQVVYSLLLIIIALATPVSPESVVVFAFARMTLAGVMCALLLLRMRLFTPASTPKQLIPIKEILKNAYPFAGSEFASAIYVRADMTIVSLLLGAAASSTYGPAVNILHITFLAPQALFFLVVPIMSQTLARGIRSFTRQGTLQFFAQMVVGGIISLAMFFFSRQIIDLVFGGAYATSGDILRLMSPIPFFRALSFALAAVLSSGGMQPERTRVQVFCALFNVVGNLAVIPYFQISGVAVIYVVTEFLLFAGYAWIAYRWAARNGVRHSKIGTDLPSV